MDGPGSPGGSKLSKSDSLYLEVLSVLDEDISPDLIQGVLVGS